MDSSHMNVEEFQKVLRELENAKQELHECKLNLRLSENIQLEYKNELDIVQAESADKQKKLMDMLKKLEEEQIKVRMHHMDEKRTMEDSIQSMNVKIEKLQEELNVYKNHSPNRSVNGHINTTDIIDGILNNTGTDYYHENEELKSKLAELTQININQDKKLQEFSEEVHDLRRMLEVKQSEYDELKANVSFLGEENMCYKAELDTLKKPIANDNDGQGNSLFAEVNDRRVYLEDKLTEIQSKYLSAIEEKKSFQNEIRQLKLENLNLVEKWQIDLDAVELEQQRSQRFLRSRIEELENTVKEYETELASSKVPVNMSVTSLKTKLEKEKKDLMQTLTRITRDNVMYAKCSSEAKLEVLKWKRKAIIAKYSAEEGTIKQNVSTKQENTITLDVFENS
ncbi:unnamed protein product [Phyllotreta striolata]|uniref:Uncharacterized protein n=1 Tax=Phyllotreta striolata TaxID=444603 RepID=A0A9N9TLX8_PHYSR|nr:unnamed protein product [Phyllotreta striolata]